MKKFDVCFIQKWPYSVEAENEDQAIDLAFKEFQAEMRGSVASAYYDDYTVACDDEEEDDDE